LTQNTSSWPLVRVLRRVQCTPRAVDEDVDPRDGVEQLVGDAATSGEAREVGQEERDLRPEVPLELGLHGRPFASLRASSARRPPKRATSRAAASPTPEVAPAITTVFPASEAVVRWCGARWLRSMSRMSAMSYCFR
jgi:hypothetical protein